MNVILVGQKGRAPLRQSLAHHPDGVQQRQADKEQGQRGAVRPARDVGQHDGRHAQKEAEELTPVVTQEEPRRIGVESQESQQASQHRNRQQHDGHIPGKVGQIGDPAEAEQRQAACQAVQTVSEIDRIGHAQQRHEREWNHQPDGQGRL